ncbi:MAG: hypothetical protein ACFB9N_02460 [Geitlerinemataceae cyanobacterium]
MNAITRLWLVRLELLALSAIAALTIVSPPAYSEEVCLRDAENGDECPVPIRLRPTFSEEGERGFAQRSFADSFIGEALGGVADPFGGGSVGGENSGLDATADDLDAGDRGLTFDAPFDPTNVIIPLDAVSK